MSSHADKQLRSIATLLREYESYWLSRNDNCLLWAPVNCTKIPVIFNPRSQLLKGSMPFLRLQIYERKGGLLYNYVTKKIIRL
jgi:hypothetical protein